MAAGLRMTIPTQLVLQALLADPGRELYGVELGDAAGLASGTVHPIPGPVGRVGVGGVALGGHQPPKRRASRAALLQVDPGRHGCGSGSVG